MQFCKCTYMAIYFIPEQNKAKQNYSVFWPALIELLISLKWVEASELFSFSSFPGANCLVKADLTIKQAYVLITKLLKQESLIDTAGNYPGNRECFGLVPKICRRFMVDGI